MLNDLKIIHDITSKIHNEKEACKIIDSKYAKAYKRLTGNNSITSFNDIFLLVEKAEPELVALIISDFE
jgi:hypothetical protein